LQEVDVKEPRKRTPARTSASGAERKPSVRKSAAPTQPGDTMPRGTDEDIRVRAYQLYVERGREPGRAMDDWLRAEHEYRQKSADGGARPDRPLASPPGS
jgi:hypothetical protein